MNIKTESKETLSTPRRVGIEILEAYNLLNDQAIEFFKAYDLTSQQQNVLAILHFGGAMSTSDILKWMYEKSAGVSRLVDRLLKKGLVEKSVNPKDKRLIVINLTKKGEELYGRVNNDLQHFEKKIGNLSEAEMKNLIALLVKFKGF